MSTVELDKFYRSKIHPQKFALWIAFASICMMFAAFTSAYIVRLAAGDWLEFAIPIHFYASTAVLLVSSVTMHLSVRGLKNGNESQYKSMLLLSFVLGVSFVVLQFMGWNALYAVGVDLKGNVSGAFFYLISIIHAVHILGGIAAMIIALITAYGKKFKVTAKRTLGLELVAQYWHFVDILWVYLLGFLIFFK